MNVSRSEIADRLFLYTCPISGIRREEWKALYSQMSSARQYKAKGLRDEKTRRQCIAADALARIAISEFAGTPKESVRFFISSGGKPFVKNLPVEFSISHAEDYVICAVSNRPVGTDIEMVRPLPPPVFNFARKRGYCGNTLDDFFLWWTQLEAAGKCAGTGLSGEMAPPQEEKYKIWGGTVSCGEAKYIWSLAAERGAACGCREQPGALTHYSSRFTK